MQSKNAFFLVPSVVVSLVLLGFMLSPAKAETQHVSAPDLAQNACAGTGKPVDMLLKTGQRLVGCVYAAETGSVNGDGSAGKSCPYASQHDEWVKQHNRYLEVMYRYHHPAGEAEAMDPASRPDRGQQYISYQDMSVGTGSDGSVYAF